MRKWNRVVVSLILMGFLVSVGTTGNSWAAPVDLKAETDMVATLQMMQKNKSPIFVSLDNGKEYNGLVIGVTAKYVVLQMQGQRSFYDAKIKINSISAIEVKTRGQ